MNRQKKSGLELPVEPPIWMGNRSNGEFWWEATYVARSLRREDPIFAKFCLAYQIKLEVMRRMLEWRMEIEHDWRIRPGVHGRNLNRLLPADIWEQWSRPMSVRKWKRIGSRCFPP